ncbi:MAG: hypothetical protein V4819_05510 [Verrucomicrobiota bacterium]
MKPLVFLLFLGTSSVFAANEPRRVNEIKFQVASAHVATALKVLKLDPAAATSRDVCFFDTADGALAARDLILRARQTPGESGDSTVKIRTTDATTKLSKAEQAIPPEQDWTGKTEPVISRSLDRNLSDRGLFARVMAGRAPVRELFNKKQVELVTARLKGFRFESLRRLGPFKTQVWKKRSNLGGFEEQLTVELWHLRKDGKSEQILEISTKATTETDAQARAVAKRFFAAAKAAGMGKPDPRTKTRKVIEFYQPRP